jgi:hypothetical protein
MEGKLMTAAADAAAAEELFRNCRRDTADAGGMG